MTKTKKIMLTCKECGFKAENLEPHIRTVHNLELYIQKHDAKVEDIVGSHLLDSTDIEGVNIRGSKLPIANRTENVPAQEYYNFPTDTNLIINDINKRKNVMLTGHTGCGKTSLVKQLAARSKNGFLRVNLNGQTTISDFIGFWTVKGGETVWIDGSLPHAMRNGLWLVLDEIDFAEAPILSVLNSVLEKNGALFLKEKGHEMVVPHENFRIFATANSVGAMSDFRGLYQGTNLLNEAFLDRWQVYFIDYLSEKEEIDVLVNVVPRMSEQMAKYIVKAGSLIRESFKNEEISATFSLRRMIDYADKMIEIKDHFKAAESTILSKVSPQDAAVIRAVLQRTLGGPST
jgi:cobaltochelatase CobS